MYLDVTLTLQFLTMTVIKPTTIRMLAHALPTVLPGQVGSNISKLGLVHSISTYNLMCNHAFYVPNNTLISEVLHLVLKCHIFEPT